MNRNAKEVESTVDYLSPICVYCVHRFDDRRGCAAFPDGIPDAILHSDHDHRKPLKGDQGIQFQIMPGKESELRAHVQSLREFDKKTWKE